MAKPETRERMLEATIDLMRKSGLAGAGINEIVRASGSPKGSVYHFFPGGKGQIVAEALETYSARVATFIEAALASKSDPEAKVRALFEAFAQRVERAKFARSCAIGAVSLDLDEDWAALGAVLTAALDEWLEVVSAHFDLGSKARTRSFASMVLTAIEGAYVRCRAEGSSRPLREAGAWIAESVAGR
jgi:AcrR family transcriptional regulator